MAGGYDQHLALWDVEGAIRWGGEPNGTGRDEGPLSEERRFEAVELKHCEGCMSVCVFLCVLMGKIEI